MWNELTNPVCVFYKRILADERMQMRHINMLALLPSHFIFFPLIKKDISYVTSPLCSYQHTHTHMQGNLRVVYKKEHRHTHARIHTGRDMRSNTTRLTADNNSTHMPSKRHGGYVAIWLSNGCPQKSRQHLFLFSRHPVAVTNLLINTVQWTTEINSKQCQSVVILKRSRLGLFSLTRCVKKRLGVCLSAMAVQPE